MKRMIAVLLTWALFSWLWIMMDIWIPMASLALIHIIEIFVVGIRRGKDNGFTVFHSAFFTFIFGVTWWGPLKRREP